MMASRNLFIRVLSFPFVYTLLTSTAMAENKFDTQAGNHFQLQVAPEFGVIDNFFFSANDEKDTTYWSLETKALLQMQYDQQLFKLDTEVVHNKYSNFNDDDHSNLQLKPQYQFKLSDNQAFFVDGELNQYYEDRGTGLSLGDGSSLTRGDEIELTSVKAGYLYGKKDSVAKIQLHAGGSSREYKTRRSITEFLDREQRYISATFDYLLSGQSYLATELYYESNETPHNPIQDKDKLIGLAGIKWQTSIASQFALLIGYQKIAFKESSFADDSGFKWTLDWRWHPIESTRINFQSGRDFEEANRLNDSYRIVDSHQIKLSSKFSEFFDLSAAIGLRNEEVVFQDFLQKEDYIYMDSRINYQRNDWLTFYIRYIYEDLDAVDVLLNYQRNSISVGFNVSI